MHPLDALINAALRGPEPLDPGLIRYALQRAAATGRHTMSLQNLYARPELTADQAARVWELADPDADVDADWAARYALRPERRDQLSAQTIAHWAPEVAGAALAAGRPHGPTPLPGWVCEQLAARPEPAVAADAAVRVPASAAALDAVDRLGTLAAQTWPAGPPDPDRVFALPQDEKDLWFSLFEVVGPSAPPALPERAALTWTSATALARIHPDALSAPATDRLLRLWLGPALRAASIDPTTLRALYTASLTAAPRATPAGRRQLAAAWRAGTALASLDAPDRGRLSTVFARAGTALTAAAETTLVGSAPLRHADLAALADTANTRTGGRAAFWHSLESVLRADADLDLTWAELFDAVDATLTSPGPA